MLCVGVYSKCRLSKGKVVLGGHLFEGNQINFLFFCFFRAWALSYFLSGKKQKNWPQESFSGLTSLKLRAPFLVGCSDDPETRKSLEFS